MADDRARKARHRAAAPAPAAAPLRMGHLAGVLILVGLSGLWHGAQAAATRAVPSVTALAPAAPAAPSRSTISVRDAYLKPTGPIDALAYFTVSNRGSRPDALLAISADEIAHEATYFPSGEETAPGTLTIAAGATARLLPGGGHVRLALHGPLSPGQSVTLTLAFSRAGVVTVAARAR